MPTKPEPRGSEKPIFTFSFSATLVLLLAASIALVTLAPINSIAQAPVGGGDRVFNSWQQTGRASITGGTTTGRVALGSSAPVAWVCNTGSVAAFVNLGSVTVTAVVATSFPVLAGSCSALFATGSTHLAAITSSSTAALLISTGSGNPGTVGSSTGASASVTGTVTADQGSPGATAWPVVSQPALGTFTNRSGTITAGGTSQTLAAVNATRKRIIIQNPCTTAGQGVTAESLYINFTSAAAVDGGTSIELAPCGSYDSGAGPVSTELIAVNAATTAHKFVAKEM